MLEFKEIFALLKLKFATEIEWSFVDDCLADYGSKEETQGWASKFWSLPMCEQNLQEQDKQLQLLRELCTCIRTLRNDDHNTKKYDEANDDWSKIIEFISPKEYMAYIYGLCSLATLPQDIIDAAPEPINDKINLTLAFNAASTFFLTLTIPGAIECGLFHTDVFQSCLNIFELLQEDGTCGIRNNLIWMFSLSYCDDLKVLFRHAQFKDHQKLRDDIMKCLLQVLYDNYTYTAKDMMRNILSNHFHVKCFEILDEIVGEHNGKVCETINLIMEMSFHMHSFPETYILAAEHISEWFIRLIQKYPEHVSKVLSTYIEAVVTNPMPTWKPSDEIVGITYAAKYDAALYAKCNISCVDTLKDTVRASDALDIQMRSLDLMEQMLQLDSNAEVPDKSREVALIKEILLSLNDRTSAVRRRASEVIILCLKHGSPITTRILLECISFVHFCEDGQHSTESKERPDVLQHAYSFEGSEELEPLVKGMPELIYKRLIDSANELDRVSGINLLENLLLVNKRILYDTKYVREISCMALDPIYANRIALLESIDRLLEQYYTCSILIDLYCRIWCCMLNENDKDLHKSALNSFNRNVLLNIQSVDFMDKPKNRLPWLIVEALLKVQPREHIQKRLTMLLEDSEIVTTQLVNRIILYLYEPMACEAWTLLAFISSRITNNLDPIILTFSDLTSHKMKSIKLLAFELIVYCLKNFSKKALRQIFKRLLSALKSGNIWLALVASALRLLNHIDGVANTPGNWKSQLFKDVTSNILKSIGNFQMEDTALASLLGIYTEIIAQSPKQKANAQVVKFVCNYVESKSKLKVLVSFDSDEERTLNWMIVVAGRFSLYDDKLAFKMSKILGVLLSKNERPQLVNNILIALSDLGQKHHTIFESHLKSILKKLNSKFPTTRLITFRCVKDVILAGKIKAKDIILTTLLSGLVDDNDQVAREADGFFICYKQLYDKSLFQSCLKECPFDFNDLPLVKSSSRDGGFISPLKGPEMTKNRRLIYNYIIASLDDNSLLLYFGQLKYLTMKTKDIHFLRSPGALDVVLDMIFIMSRICIRTKERRATSMEPLKQLQRCLPCVPQVSRNLNSVMNPELQNSLDQFCKVITMRFSNFTDIAEPMEFWKKYKQMSESKVFQSVFGDIANYSELPVRRQKPKNVSNVGVLQTEDLDDLATALTFQLYNW